ncbi:MAG: ribonuclease T [Gammaproteobacteria bacterium]|nr:MAG: ribonuclease T [Gammaproteobacteria bacterium]
MKENKYIPGKTINIEDRFRGFLPVVVDVETGGLNSQTDALLEIAAIVIHMDEKGMLYPGECNSTHVKPFEGANIEESALKINGIKPDHPLRAARDESQALGYIFKSIRTAIKASNCNRAILVGHNATFDLSFVRSAVDRCGIKRNPFHKFSTFDTVSLAGLTIGQTVLSKSVEYAGLGWNEKNAHSAIYDTQKTAELFCHIHNTWEMKNI